LGEITIRPKLKSFAWTRMRVEHTSFPRVLAWASHSCLSEAMRRSKQELVGWARCSSSTRASFCYSRL